MFFIPLVVSLTSLLCSVPVSCCVYDCAVKPVFTPSRLVVKHGDSASATCTVSPSFNDSLGLERAVGYHTENGNTITWTVHNLTEWSTKPLCYYSVNQCCSALPVTAYKPPDSVSFRFTPSGPMREGYINTLQCDVKNVAPVQNLNVTFHRGQTVLAGLNISNPKKEPVSEVFSLNITASREDDGAQYWCEAKLELGPDGPQPPPVVESQKITATVLYMPHVEGSSNPDPIVYTVGDRLQLNCSAEGNPPPSFTWLLPGPPRDGTTYIIESVTEQHEGLYVCQISNYMGSVNATFNVKVKAKTTTTAPTTTTTTAPTTTTTTAPTTTTTTAATTTATTTTPTTTQTTTVLTTAPSSSTSITLTRWFITWFMILFSLVI